MYEVGAQGQTAAKAKQTRSHPLLCVDWSADGQQVLSGGTDGLAKIWNLGSNQEITIGQHQGAIKSDKRRRALIPAVAAPHGTAGAAAGRSLCSRCVRSARSVLLRSIHFVKEMNVVVTGSFDKTIKYWSRIDAIAATVASTVLLLSCDSAQCVS